MDPISPVRVEPSAAPPRCRPVERLGVERCQETSAFAMACVKALVLLVDFDVLLFLARW